MQVSRRILMKHVMHGARDLDFHLEADFITRKVLVGIDWIDTALLESFICVHAVQLLNDELEKVNKLPPLDSLDSFNIELHVASSARFRVQFVRSETDSRDKTLVMQLLKD